MLFKSIAATVASLASLASVCAEDLPAIEIVGNKFYYSNNGTQFLMRGVAYQQDTANSTSSFSDPLADAASCKRDIPYLEELQTNVIRVYALNVSQDHTECMSLLQDAGIYVIADLSEPDLSIDRDDPEWNMELYERYTGVVDLFHNYTNILGFFAGNEVTNNKTNTDASAFVKAAIRDTKAYIKAQGYRTIPVGYSSNDDSTIRGPLADYFACGDDDERADFFGINMYEWCGSSSYSASGYETITELYSNITIPLFFSEYGCNEVTPRTFQEVGTLYGDDMLKVWSGGIVYMYFQETNDYGLVSIVDSAVSTLTDFKNLKSQLLSISPSLATVATTASSEGATLSCPTEYSNWEASTDLPPTPDESICNCMENSLTCVVASSVSSDDYADLYAYVCGEVSCDGVTGNGTSGDYGAYSGCSAEERLNFVLNLYYIESGNDASGCDFSGSASTKSASTASSCVAVLSSAGTSGLGTVSGSVTSNANAGSTTGSGSSSSSTASSTSTKSSGSIKQVSFDGVTKGLMVIVSVALGAGVIFM
ncbi:pH-responsive protein 2 [[Candida] railenensis]|uniref:1,3-beta-glucanosyltransferase n=1 Tax=[Candida] railenensis TaxID=45579 RepID=A0A9P0QUK8_9ASCO|nr:pH-responsive protein 2 [[Candida] railenensis]